jgi:hypothetical protein
MLPIAEKTPLNIKLVKIDSYNLSDPQLTAQQYTVIATIAGVKFRAAITIGVCINGRWNPNNVWVLASIDKEDPELVRRVNEARAQAQAEGFNPIDVTDEKRIWKLCRKCRNAETPTAFKDALLLPKTAEITAPTATEIATRPARRAIISNRIEIYELCLVHGSYTYHDIEE